MEHPSVFRLIWIAIAISVTATKEDVIPSAHCPCRLIAKCPDGIQKNSEDLSFLSICESPDMIRCCTFSENSSVLVDNNSSHILETVPSNDKLSQDDNSTGEIKSLLSMTWELPSAIVPPENFASPEYTLANEEVNLNNIEINNPERIGVDMLRDVRRTIVRHFVTFAKNQPFATDAIFDMDSPRARLNNIATSESIKTDSTDSIAEAMSFESKKIQPRYQFAKYFLPNDAEYRRSPRVSSQLIKRNVSNQPNSEESESSDRLNVHSETPDTSEIGSFETEMDDGSRLNAHIDNNHAAGKSSSELGESATPTRARVTERYEEQSMISSSPKDVPTTTIINSVERKTPSETFLPLDRVSAQPINKNTSTTNKSKVTRNNGGGIIARRSPLLLSNAKKIKQLARHRGIGRTRNNPRENAMDRHESLHVERVIETTAASAGRRDDPLQARDDQLTRLAAPVASQKDKLNENARKGEYKNSIVRKKDTKSLLEVDRSGFRTERKGSVDEDANKDAAEMTTATVPARGFRFPPRVLPTRPTPKKERNPTNINNIENAKRRFPNSFRRFYEMRDNFRLKINDKLHTERTKSAMPSSTLKHSNGLSAKNNETATKEKMASGNSVENHSSDIRMDSISILENSMDSGKSLPDSHKSSTLNLQNVNSFSEKIATHLNVSVPPQGIENSTQKETNHANDVGSSTIRNAEIVQTIAENAERSLKFNANEDDDTQKYVRAESPIGRQSSRNKSQTVHPSEPTGLSVNTVSEQVSGTSSQAYRTAHVASSLDNEEIAEASSRSTVIVNSTETDTKNIPLSMIPATSEKLDASNETQIENLKEVLKKEKKDTSRLKTDATSNRNVDETTNEKNILSEAERTTEDMFIEEKDKKMDKNADATNNNYTKNVDIDSTKIVKRNTHNIWNCLSLR